MHAPDTAEVAQRVTLETPLGAMVAIADERGLLRLDFVDETAAREAPPIGDAFATLADELTRYFAGEPVRFRTELAPQGTPFQLAVWRSLREIPHGETRSYAQLATAIGRPTAVRAVAQANARNPISILIPCHRVIGADGSLTGYASGIERKRWLLDRERGDTLF